MLIQGFIGSAVILMKISFESIFFIWLAFLNHKSFKYSEIKFDEKG